MRRRSKPFNRVKLYWMCQFGGWTSLFAYEILGYAIRFGFEWSYLTNGLINVALGIALTHAYRLLIHRWGWNNLPFDQLIPRILVAVVVQAAILTALNYPLDGMTVPKLGSRQFWESVLYLSTWSKHILIWWLIYHLFHYFEYSKNAEVERIQLQSSVKEFEMKALRSQLNPHFVFNALNSIRALVLENPQKAQQGITQLSNILRNSLAADRYKTVLLSEELKTVEDYLALEKVRYEDRLVVDVRINADTLDVPVPPLMVQTLVENAVKHGISKPLLGGFVSITARLQKHFLYLDIKNTGKLLGTDSGGYGLINTAQRLELLYGAEASFKIRQESDDVVWAQVKLPV